MAEDKESSGKEGVRQRQKVGMRFMKPGRKQEGLVNY
jgi:hypothetical protein